MVTVDNYTYQLETPFMVIATQNPIEMEGTYASPRPSGTGSWRGSPWATRSRPWRSRCSTRTHTGVPLDDLEPVTDAAEIRKLSAIVGQVYVSEAVQRYTWR